jgi:hypothetical protein
MRMHPLLTRGVSATDKAERLKAPVANPRAAQDRRAQTFRVLKRV